MKTFLTATILCGGVLLAADFWQTKKPSDWTEKEARTLIEGSPWVKETTPKMMDAGRSSRGESGGRSGDGRGGGSGGMGGGGGGGGPMAGPAGGQMPQVRVTFETALPVAEAKGRIEIQDAFKGVREEYVVISVSGMRMMGGMGSRLGAQTKGKAEAPTPESRKEQQEEMQARLLQLTTLKVKDDKVFQPAEARIQQTVNGQVMLFSFPRKELDLKPEDKSLTFKTTMGPVEISVKFNLKEMMYQEKLAL